MATIYLGDGDNPYNVPLGETTVDAQGGTDTLALDWSAVDGQIRTTQYYNSGESIRL